MTPPVERIVLSESDSKLFLDALANPPEPSKALKLAAAAYKKDYITKAQPTDVSPPSSDEAP